MLEMALRGVPRAGLGDSMLRGAAERQMGRQREERICVRASSLVGRKETMSPRTPSGRRCCGHRRLDLDLVLAWVHHFEGGGEIPSIEGMERDF
jgi:hypothetical protein